MKKFNVGEITTQLIQWIKEYFQSAGEDSKAIIGISGGKDSSVVAALCSQALGKGRVIGVTLPQGVQTDIDCSWQLISHLGIASETFNIDGIVKEIIASQRSQGEVTNQARINLPPRIRTAILMFVAQCHGGRMANTCNLSEDCAPGNYSTLFGDNLGQFAPLQNLTVTEIRAIGDYLGLPHELVHKVPTDGLCGSTDEENIGQMVNIPGFTYERFDKLIRGNGHDFNEQEVASLIDGYKRGKFKNQMVVLPKPDFGLHNFFEQF